VIIPDSILILAMIVLVIVLIWALRPEDR